MFTSKIKIILFLTFFLLLIVGASALGYSLYNNGKQKAELECKEKEIQVETKTVEVIKYIYKDHAEILLKPNKTFKELLERMKKNEI